MAMDEFANKVQGGFYSEHATFGGLSLPEGFPTKENDMQELEISLQALTEVEFRLAYSSEKLVNLHVLYIYLLAQENDLDAMDSKNNFILTNFLEKALTFDLLSGILNSEVRELDNFMDTLQEEIVDARYKIISCRHLTEVFFMMEEKLHDSEESMKQFQQQLSELKMQSSKLQKTLVAFQHENRETGNTLNSSQNGQLTDTQTKSNDQKVVERQRYILRMLEKSLARELELEKKLAESRKNEELKLKLHFTEQVALHMEEALEVVWGRFLEADNAAEVLMGISKGLMGRLQVTEFNLNGSIKKENKLNSKVQSCTEQLKAKDAALEKFEEFHIEHIKQNAEVFSLREKIKLLEEERRDFQVRINALIAENGDSHEQLIEMESFVESLKESIDIAENRAESAEAKVTELTDSNLELTEELSFLKGSDSTVEKKVGSLEKQLRELDIQLQNAKASSEVSQEQQNMLYSAIWDMELLIEELKSKVSKAESKKETTEDQCIVLSETNLELNKELDLMRSKMISLKTSLEQANNTKISSAKEINTRTTFIMDMVMQLAIERERITKQLDALKRKNKSLLEKLKNTKIGVPQDVCDNGLNNGNEYQASNIDSSNGSCTKSFDEEGIVPLYKPFRQVGETSEALSSETQEGPSISANKSARCGNLFLSVTIILVPLISAFAICLFNKETFFFLKSFGG